MQTFRYGLGCLILMAGTLAGCLDEVSDEGFEDIVDSADAELSGVSANPAWNLFSGLSGVEQIEVAQSLDGSLALFARTTTGSIGFSRQVAPNGGWTAPISLGGSGLRDLAVGRNQDGRLEVVAIGGDGAVYDMWQLAPSSSSFSGWANLGGTNARDVTVGLNQDGRLSVFAILGDYQVYERRQLVPNAGLSDWQNVGGVLTRIGVIANQDGRLALFGLDPDGALDISEQTAPSGAFGAFTVLGGAGIRDFDVTRNQDGRLEVATIASNGALYGRWQTTAGGLWSGWSYLGGNVSDLDFARAGDGALHLFMIDPYRDVQDEAQNGPGGAYSFRPYLASRDMAAIQAERNQDGRLEVFGVGTDRNVYHVWQTAPGGPWRSLPAPPTIIDTAISPTFPAAFSYVTTYWTAAPSSGCSLEVSVDLVRLDQSTVNIGSWGNPPPSAGVTFFLERYVTVRTTAACKEGKWSGTTVQTVRNTTIDTYVP
jgi:hypothetical protein